MKQKPSANKTGILRNIKGRQCKSKKEKEKQIA